MNTLPPLIETEPVRESVLAMRLNIPRAQFKAWREDATALVPDDHWHKDESGAYVLTPAGQLRVLELMAVPVPVPPVQPVTVPMRAIAAGAMPRILRCRPVSGEGPMVSVRLLGANVFAAKFRRGDLIQALPTETEGIFEYDGPVPRRMRL